MQAVLTHLQTSAFPKLLKRYLQALKKEKQEMMSTDDVLQTDNLEKTDSGKLAVGAHSRPLRFLIAALVVAAWWALGYVLHANVSEYTLLGVPILLAFQCWIQRQPLVTLWVRSGPPLRMDAWFFIFWILFALAPAYDVLMAVESKDLWSAATACGRTSSTVTGRPSSRAIVVNVASSSPQAAPPSLSIGNYSKRETA